MCSRLYQKEKLKIHQCFSPTLKTYTFKVFLKNKKEQYINDYQEKLSSDGQHFNKHDNINKTCTQTATSHLKPMNFKKNMTYVNENSGLDLVQALKYGEIKQSFLFL